MVEGVKPVSMRPVKQWRALYREYPVKFNAADIIPRASAYGWRSPSPRPSPTRGEGVKPFAEDD